MDAYSGKYYLQSGPEQDATILLLKDKVSIGLRDEHGNPRVLYWTYNQIIRDNFWKRGISVVRYGTYPVQTIEVETKEFADKLEGIFKERERTWVSRLLNKNQWRLIRFMLVFFIVILSSYIWLVPFLAERMAKRVPVSYEERLGDGIYNVLQPTFTIDAARTAYINDFFRELQVPSKYNIRITVVKENIANAFAMPGGHIIVYDKLLYEMSDYEDLAALLSHEFTHVNEKHTTRALFRQQASSLFISIIFGDLGSVGNAIASNADGLKSLDYSRRLEKDADLNGLKILSERKIDCNGFIRLFELLKRETEREGVQTTEWISSHPDLGKRIAYTKASALFNKNGVEANETLKTLFLKMKTE
jgi:Zn-dependent protease with chaperone function